MPRRYYTLAVRESDHCYWSPQFGDYDRETVEAERQDYLDHGYKARDLKIVVSDPSQSSISNAIAKLNSR